MNSTTISPEHAKRVRAALGPSLRYLSKLRERMVAVGFLPADPLFAATVKAHDALQAASMAWHYASCPGGIESSRMGKGDSGPAGVQ
jgi:hypothetical protein